MNTGKNQQQAGRGDTKSLLSTIKMTTTLGAVSLTLAGWGLLARVESINAQQADPVAQSVAMLESAVTKVPATLAETTLAISPGSLASATRAALAPTATSAATSTATPAATATVPPTATAAPVQDVPAASQQSQVKLNVVQWVQTNAGDPVAVVQDGGGTLWYVWGPDVDRIEQGLQPQYQPVPVNQVARSRHS